MAAKKKTEETTDETPNAEPSAPAKRIEAAPVMEVDLSEPDEDDDDDEPRKASRSEKKRDRGNLREEAEKLRERVALAEQQAAYATGAAQAMAQRMQQPTQERDELDVYEEGAQREQKLLVQEWNHRKAQGNVSQDEWDDFEKRGNAVQSRLAQVAAERVIRRRQSQQPQGQNVLAVIQARYPDVAANPRALDRAITKHRLAVNDPLNPAPDDWNTADRMMQEVREEFGMAPKSNGNGRSSTNSRRLEGGGAGASGNVKGGEAQTKVTLTKDDVAAADAAYPHIPEKERYLRYARLVQANRKTA